MVVLSDGNDTRVNSVASTQVDAQNRTILTLNSAVGAPFLIGALALYGPFKLQMRINGYNAAEGSIAAGLTSIRLNGTVAGLAAGSYVVLAEGQSVEGVRINGISAGTGFTSLDLETPLENSYALATTVIYGNVASATHGQTVVENALASGDQSLANQSFKLHQKPVSYVHNATTTRGVANTLQITVQGKSGPRLKRSLKAAPRTTSTRSASTKTGGCRWRSATVSTEPSFRPAAIMYRHGTVSDWVAMEMRRAAKSIL